MVSASSASASLQCLRVPAGSQQVKTPGEALRQHVQLAGQLALPFDHAMRRVHAVQRQDRAEIGEILGRAQEDPTAVQSS